LCSPPGGAELVIGPLAEPIHRCAQGDVLAAITADPPTEFEQGDVILPAALRTGNGH